VVYQLGVGSKGPVLRGSASSKNKLNKDIGTPIVFLGGKKQENRK
jgi:hypothetical protein